MSEDEVFMDTDIFTCIVNNMRNSANNLVLSDMPMEFSSCLDGFNAGIEIKDILKKVIETSELYRYESTDSLPRALFTLRDSMIEIDNAFSNSLTIERIGERIDETNGIL